MRRAVVEVAVVVVRGQEQQVAAGGRRSRRRRACTCTSCVTAGGRRTGQARGELQGGVVVEVERAARAGRGACRSQPASAVDLALAVGLTAAGPAALAGQAPGCRPAALRAREAAEDPGDAVRLVAAVVREVDVADARAAGGRRAVAGVAVAAADLVLEEAAADAGDVQAQDGVDVGDAPRRAWRCWGSRRCCPSRGPTRGRRCAAISPVLRQPRAGPEEVDAAPFQKALQAG